MHCIAWYKMVNRYFNLLALNFPHNNAIMLDYFDILIAPFLWFTTLCHLGKVKLITAKSTIHAGFIFQKFK